MQATEYRKMSVEELEQRESELRRDIFNLRTRAATKELENVTLIRQARRDLARLLTVLSEKRVETAGAEA